MLAFPLSGSMSDKHALRSVDRRAFPMPTTGSDREEA